jgi:hypothetical protein
MYKFYVGAVKKYLLVVLFGLSPSELIGNGFVKTSIISTVFYLNELDMNEREKMFLGDR